MGELASVGHLQQGLHREAHLGQALLFQNVMRQAEALLAVMEGRSHAGRDREEEGGVTDTGPC